MMEHPCSIQVIRALSNLSIDASLSVELGYMGEIASPARRRRREYFGPWDTFGESAKFPPKSIVSGEQEHF